MIDRACISLTRKCQLNCIYCHFDKNMNKNIIHNDLTLEQINTIIDNIINYISLSSLEQFKLGIVGSGEPLLEYNKIISILEYINQKDIMNRIKLYLITNGILYDNNKANFFYKYRDKIKISFSIDGYEELHNHTRIKNDNTGSFQDVIKAINIYKEVNQSTPLINVTIHKWSIINKERLLKFLEENFYEVTFSKLVDNNDSHLFITDTEYFDFIKFTHQYNLKLRQVEQQNKYDCTMYGNYCGVGLTNIYFSEDNVYHCGRFIDKEQYIIGKYDTKLADIEDYIKQHVNPFCRKECYYDIYVRRSV